MAALTAYGRGRRVRPGEEGYMPRQNSGNFCFFNAAMQLLCAASELAHCCADSLDKVDRILSRRPKVSDTAAWDWFMANMLVWWADERKLGCLGCDKDDCIATATCKELYNNTNPQSPYQGDMGDSHEVITHVLDVLGRAWPEMAALFVSKYEKTVECLTCHTISRTEEPMVAVNVPILPSVQRQDMLAAAMEAMHRGEVLRGDNSYHCSTCDVKVEAARRTEVPVQISKYLIFNCLRFGSNGGKIAQPVDLKACVKLIVDDNGLSAAAAGASAPTPACAGGRICSVIELRLNAVILHRGKSQHSGHYVCLARVPTGDKWILYDDDTLTYCDAPFGSSDVADVVAREWYQALYERVGVFVQEKVDEARLRSVLPPE